MENEKVIQIFEDIYSKLSELDKMDKGLSFTFFCTHPISENRDGDNCSIGITAGHEPDFVNSFIHHFDVGTMDIHMLVMLLKSIDLLFQLLEFDETLITAIRGQMCLKTGLSLRFFSALKRIKNDGTLLN